MPKAAGKCRIKTKLLSVAFKAFHHLTKSICRDNPQREHWISTPPGLLLVWKHRETHCFGDPVHGIPKSVLSSLSHSNASCYSSLTQILIPPVLSLSPSLEGTMPFLEEGRQQDIRERRQVWILWSDLNINELTQAGVLTTVWMAGRGAEMECSSEAISVIQGKERDDLSQGNSSGGGEQR